jgi:hypothetical protein
MSQESHPELKALPPARPMRASLTNPIGYAMDHLWEVCWSVCGDDAPPEIKARFDQREIASMETVFSNTGWFESDTYHLLDVTHYNPPEHHREPRHLGFLLGLPPSYICNHPDTAKLIVAHEAKHASLRYSAAIGKTNIASIRKIIHKAKMPLLDHKNLLEKNIAESERKKNNTSAALEKFGYTVLSGTHRVARLFNLTARLAVMAVDGRLSCAEEHICDNFAVRAAPETNIDDYEVYLKDFNTRDEIRQLYEDETNAPAEKVVNSGNVTVNDMLPEYQTSNIVYFFASNFCRTHPSHEERLERMRQKQREILKNG